MVERGDGLITSIEKGAANELLLEAFHGEKGGIKVFEKKIEKKRGIVKQFFKNFSITGNRGRPGCDIEALKDARANARKYECFAVYEQCTVS